MLTRDLQLVSVSGVIQGGAGLHTTINSVSKKFHGIVNGIDEKVWNPATDPHLEFHFSEDNLRNKQLIKNKLRQRLGLQIQENGEAERPLVSDLDHHNFNTG